MNANNPQLQLQVGGQLNPQKHVFVSRQDLESELLEALAQGEYCNLLSSRQVGKSSVMMQTALRLKERGIQVVVIDVAGELGAPATATEWYQGFLGKVVRDLRIDLDVGRWWDQQTGTPNQRLLEFFRSQVFASLDSPVVIFVDEIDATLKLPYTDDFFTAMRTMYNHRASEPAFEKITFCLIGVATPNELVKDRRTTTYNVGKTFEVRDFELGRDDLSALTTLLADDPHLAENLLQRVLDWTGGHPYLTLCLCQEVRKNAVASPQDIDGLVREAFTSFSRVQSDPHFQQISRFLGERVTDQLAAYRLYDRILRGRTESDRAGRTQIELKLSGIVKRNKDGNLVVRNRIYQHIFDRRWVKQSKPQQTLRRVQQFAMAATILLMLGGSWFAYDRMVLDPVRQDRVFAQGLVQGYLAAEITEVPRLIEQIKQHRQWTVPLLRDYSHSENPRWRLRANLGLLAAVDRVDERIDYLWQRLLTDTSEDGAVIARVLETYAANDPRSLTARMVRSDADNFRALLPRLAEQPDRAKQTKREAISILSGEIESTSGPSPLELHRRRADAAIALWLLGDHQEATEILKVDKDPEPLTQFVHRCKERGVQPTDLWDQLIKADHTTVRYGLLLALGEFGREEIPDEQRSHWFETLGEWYANDPKSVIHSACGWLLRHWGETEQVDAVDRTAPAYDPQREWFVVEVKYGDDPDAEADYFTFIVFPPGKFLMGSSEYEEGRYDDEDLREVDIEQPFALCDREITNAQYARFLASKSGDAREQSEPLDPQHPAVNVSWNDAVEYSRWLERFGVRSRLPSEQEWEYACRAGTVTPFSHGSDENKLTNYARYLADETGRAGELRSNLRGLLDMHGNVWEWCSDWQSKGFGVRVIRGGGWWNDSRVCRSASRSADGPASNRGVLGFRLAADLLGQDGRRREESSAERKAEPGNDAPKTQ